MKCLICNKTLKRMSPFHLKNHKISMKGYIEKYGSPTSVERVEFVCPICGKIIFLTPLVAKRRKSCGVVCQKEAVARYYIEHPEQLDRQCQKGSATQKAQYRNGTRVIWNYGLTKENDSRVLKMSKTNSTSHTGLSSYLLGKTYEEMWGKEKADEIVLKQQMHRDYSSSKTGRGKCGRRSDLGNQFFRSTWEANFARILNYLEIKWLFEPKRFLLADRLFYVPDFYLPDLDIYVEVKGYFSEKYKIKVKRFILEYPDIGLKILDSISYGILTRKYGSIIECWEK